MFRLLFDLFLACSGWVLMDHCFLLQTPSWGCELEARACRSGFPERWPPWAWPYSCLPSMQKVKCFGFLYSKWYWRIQERKRLSSCFCCLLCFLRTSPVISLLQRNLLLLRCVRSQTFRSSSDILLPYSMQYCVVSLRLSAVCCPHCHLRWSLPRGPVPCRGQQLHPALPRGSWRVPGISEYGHPHRITWVGTMTLVTTWNKRLQHRQLRASGFLFFSSWAD